LKSRSIVCTVPDKRKSQAVQRAVQGPLTPAVPASILQEHKDLALYLDKEAASLLNR
jgi:glucosamine-6-phosphate deaminase